MDSIPIPESLQAFWSAASENGNVLWMSASAAVLLASLTGIYFYRGTMKTNEQRRQRYRFLRRLMRTATLKLQSIENTANQMEAGDFKSVVATSEKTLLTAHNNDAKALSQGRKQLGLLEERAHKLLESLDNVKPNGILLEYLQAYPKQAPTEEEIEAEERKVEDEGANWKRQKGWASASNLKLRRTNIKASESSSAVGDPDADEDEPVRSQEVLLWLLTRECTNNEKGQLFNAFDGLKRKRKAIVKKILDMLSRVDQLVEQTEKLIANFSS